MSSLLKIFLVRRESNNWVECERKMSYGMIQNKLFLLLLMQPVSDLLGNQGGVAAGAVVDDQVDLDLVLYGLRLRSLPCPRSSPDPACPGSFCRSSSYSMLHAPCASSFTLANCFRSGGSQVHQFGQIQDPRLSSSYAMPHAPCAMRFHYPARSTRHTGRWPYR